MPYLRDIILFNFYKDNIMGFILVYITNPSRKDAEKVAMHLLKKRLIACAITFPVSSSYWWKNKIEKTKEHVFIAKTLERNFERIKKEVKKIHPYEIPCITKINVEANEEFEEWLRVEVK
ncbi:MAG: divalent-cation tolerance protein CutA [Thaumarchaeota archaeon]|nr:divalent-cation tolerance protein CutA [Nitrososphaerota archaeon]